jgi:hypothetical protein
MVVTARAGLGDEEATEWIEEDAALGTTMHLGGQFWLNHKEHTRRRLNVYNGKKIAE